MVRNETNPASDEKIERRQALAHKVTRLVDDLPLFPTSIDALLVSGVKPSIDGMEILRLIECDPTGEILATLLSTQVLTKLSLSAADFEKAGSMYKARIEKTSQ
ncbi:MAG: hypothetical protein ABIF19_05125 [Planctomycetota bacterium]